MSREFRLLLIVEVAHSQHDYIFDFGAGLRGSDPKTERATPLSSALTFVKMHPDQ